LKRNRIICPEVAAKVFVKLPEKIDFFKICLENRIFGVKLQICMEKSNFFNPHPRPPDFKPD